MQRAVDVGTLLKVKKSSRRERMRGWEEREEKEREEGEKERKRLVKGTLPVARVTIIDLSP